MSNQRNIYPLEGLSPEVKAVTFAKCSRSPDSFSDIAKELTEEKSAQFHEKWVVGYGHGSVAEHSVLSIAMENVTILATKVIEDNRLASYTEKSTRYQVFDRNTYYKPKKIMDDPELGPLYQKTGNLLFDTYTELVEPMKEYMKRHHPQPEGMSDGLYQNTLKARACDEIRYILPTSTLTNLGMTINARNLEYAISKFLSHPLDEIKELGEEIKKVGLKITPTLIKYADYNEYMVNNDKKFEEIDQELFNQTKPQNKAEVEIVDFNPLAENKLVAALLYKQSKLPYHQIAEKVKGMSQEEKEKIIDEAMKRRGPHDRPPRELEHIYYTFDILMDYGAFRDIQRHRICTQTNQKVTIAHGYDTPQAIIDAGFEDKFKNCMETANETYEKIFAKYPDEAQYIVPLAYRKRTLFTWNLRELHHFIPLRSSKAGHWSYRHIAQLCYDKLMEIHPVLAKYIRVNKDEKTLHT